MRARSRLSLRKAAIIVAGSILLGGIGLADPVPSATGSTVTATNTSKDASGDPASKNADGTVTFTVSVTVKSLSPNGTLWKDLKLIAPRKQALPKLKKPSSGKINVRPGDDPGTPNTNEGDTKADASDGTGWHFKQGTQQAGSGLTIYTGTSSTDPGGEMDSPNATDDPATTGVDESDADGDGETDKIPYQFELTFEKGTDPSSIRSCSWELTDSGSKNDSTPIETDGPASGVNLPTARCTINDDDPATVATNVTTSIPVLSETWLAAHTYAVYTSHSLNIDYNDQLEIGINSEVDPIPSSWGITLSGETGVLDVNGELPGAGFQVTVPNSPSLAGEEFYAVFAVNNADGDLLFSSSPVQITIVGP